MLPTPDNADFLSGLLSDYCNFGADKFVLPTNLYRCPYFPLGVSNFYLIRKFMDFSAFVQL